MSDLTAKGMKTRRRVLGDAHVNRAEAAKTAADAAFQALITDAAWGHVWARDTISLRERSMLTIALLAGLGNDHELALHIRATANTGATETDVTEALLHVAIYAGVPRANHAIRIAKETFAAMASATPEETP
ncbi:MAG: 4-carboxymuconolactone decarboxylase [Pseudomonadota bacterium]